MAARRIHYLHIIPVLLLSALSVWHIHSYLTMEAMGSMAQHTVVLVLVFFMVLASLFFRGARRELTRYLEALMAPLRPPLVGMACFIMGGLHFITLPEEPVFLKLGFLVTLLAFFETAGLANRFQPAVSGHIPEVTKGTLKRLLLAQTGMLVMVFVLSVVLLYLSLMVVVGFTDTWTILVLAAMMMLALAFMAVVRKL